MQLEDFIKYCGITPTVYQNKLIENLYQSTLLGALTPYENLQTAPNLNKQYVYKTIYKNEEPNWFFEEYENIKEKKEMTAGDNSNISFSIPCSISYSVDGENWKPLGGWYPPGTTSKKLTNFKPTQIIFSNNVTTVFFEDGTKETVKPSEGDKFSAEVGVAMAIVQKMYGSRSQYVKMVNKAYETSVEREKHKKSKKENK